MELNAQSIEAIVRKVISGMDGESIALSMSYNKGNQLTAMANGMA